MTEINEQKCLAFNILFLSEMRRTFFETEELCPPGHFPGPDSRYRVLPDELEKLVLETIPHDLRLTGCPCPDLPYANSNEIVYGWANWLVYHRFKHNSDGWGDDVDEGIPTAWSSRDCLVDDEERGYTPEMYEQLQEFRYRTYYARHERKKSRSASSAEQDSPEGNVK